MRDDLPERWTQVAHQTTITSDYRKGFLRWVTTPGSPIEYEEAKNLLDFGHLISAQRRAFPGGGMVLLVKRRA